MGQVGVTASASLQIGAKEGAHCTALDSKSIEDYPDAAIDGRTMHHTNGMEKGYKRTKLRSGV